MLQEAYLKCEDSFAYLVAMSDKSIADFLAGKSGHTIELYNHFIETYSNMGIIGVHPAKTMIGISNAHRRIAWITQLGKNFIHIVFPFRQAYPANLCFNKIAQVPGMAQFNHHFRMLYKEDLNEEVIHFMQMAYSEEE
ncbi:MAG TPA: hypothetical protein PKM63_17950 [Panacibacter sp.]|nr:hypothetical protein [Panacibacter sp.]HNP46183.1 hypothetical protein [Panacibacter sp.]